MAVGFKVADAYVAVHTEDDTRAGRQKIERDTDRWSNNLGGRIGRNLLRGLTQGLRGGLMAVGQLMAKALMAGLQLVKFGLIAGVVASAIGGLASAIGGLVPLITQLVMVAKQALGVFLLWPAAIVSIISIVATVKLGIKGMGDAMKAVASGDAAALNEALKKLAPSAQHVVQRLAQLKPAFDKMRLNIQSQLFAGLWKYVLMLGKLIPILSTEMSKLARVLNGAVRDAVRFLLTAQSRLDLAAVLRNVTATAHNLFGALRPVMQILRDISVVGTRVMIGLSNSIGGVLTRLADRVSQMRASGDLEKMITDGIAAVKMFGGLLKDVLGILGGIGRAAGQGAGLFSFFDRLNKLINSVAGQKALRDLFDTLSRIGEALMPVLTALLKALVPVVDAIAAVSVAFAPGLIVLVNGLAKGISNLVPGVVALAPLLEGIGAILPFVGTGISMFLQAFTPGVVELLKGIGSAIGALLGYMVPLGQALGGVAAAIGPALVPLIKILAELIVQLAPGTIAFLGALATALEALVPIAPIVGQGLSAILEILAPLLPILAQVLAPLLVDLALAFVVIAKVAQPFLKVLSDLMNTVGNDLIASSLQSIALLLPLVADAGKRIFDAWKPALPVLQQFLDKWAGLMAEALVKNGPMLITLFARLTEVAVILAQAFSQNLIEVLQDIMPMLPALVDTVMQLSLAMDQLMIALLPLVPPIALLIRLFVDFLVQSGLLKLTLLLVMAAIQTTIMAVRILTSIVKALLSPFSDAKKGVESFGTAASGQVGKVLKIFQNLGTTILNAVKNFGTLLFGAGKSLISGLVGGIKAGVAGGAIAAAANQAAKQIADYFPHSPAKKGPLSGQGDPKVSGQQIPQRMAQGMMQNASVLGAAANQLASMLLAARAGAGGLGSLQPAGVAAAGVGAMGAMGVPGGGGTNVQVRTGDLYAYLDLGNGVHQVVKATIRNNPELVAAATDEGRRTRGFTHSPRAKT